MSGHWGSLSLQLPVLVWPALPCPSARLASSLLLRGCCGPDSGSAPLSALLLDAAASGPGALAQISNLQGSSSCVPELQQWVPLQGALDTWHMI